MTTQQTPTPNTPSTMPTANALHMPASVPQKLVHKHAGDEHYQQTCKACRAADAERSRPGFCALSDADLERTTFLIPEMPYDALVCRAYLTEKYPEARYIGSSIDLAKLGGWADGEQIVIVRRDTWPRPPGPGQKREKDVEGKWEYLPIPVETFVSEVVESAAIDVKKTIQLTAADRFTKSQLDIRPLLARLSELMAQPYRIDLPRHPNDTVAYFVHG